MLDAYQELLALEADLIEITNGGAFADARGIFRRQLDALRPAEDISTHEVALEYRLIKADGGAVVKYRHDLTPHLKDVHDAFDDHTKRIIAIKGPARSGKALALDTPLPTPGGWTTMGQVKVGDVLFDDLGVPCRVTFVTEVQRGRDCYEVEFSDGSVIVADAEHLWEVQWVRRPKPVRTPVLATKVMRTIDMVGSTRDGSAARGRKRYRVAVAGALTCAAAALPIDPYVLGAWLGDGTAISQEITNHESDAEILEHIRAAGYRTEIRGRSDTGTCRVGILTPTDDRAVCSRGHETTRYDDGSCKTCRQQQHRESYHGEARDPIVRLRFAEELRGAGVFGNKHIPATYLRASVEQRLELLRGLMDTDGTISPNGGAVFTSTIPALAESVHELVASLGMKPTIRSRASFCYTGGRKIPSARAYNVAFRAYDDQPVFHLARKRALQPRREHGNPNDTGSRRIVDIRAVESVPVRCIQVDSPRHLFLAGRAMIPTHNTIAAENFLLKVGMYGPSRNVLWYMHSEPDVKRYVLERVDFFLREHAELWAKRDKSKVPAWNLRKIDGMLWEWLAANASTTRARSASLIIADEVDAMRPAIRDAWVTLAKNRQREYGSQAKMFIASHPDAGPLFGIDSILVDSDLRVRMAICPFCAHRIGAAREVPSDRRMAWNMSDLMKDAEDMPRDELLDFIAEHIRLVCPFCKNHITNEERLEMRFGAEWMGRGQSIDHHENIIGDLIPSEIAGFVFHAMDAPFDSMAELARQWAAAKREFDETGSSANLKEVSVKTIGETYEAEEAGSTQRDWKTVKARLIDTGYTMGTVPRGVDFIVAFIDVQGNRFEPGFIGFSRTIESWLIDRFAARQLEGFQDLNPGYRLEDWDVLENFLKQTYPLNDGSGRHLGVAKLCVDTGGVPGVTDNARRWAANLASRPVNPVPPWRISLQMGDAHTKGDFVGPVRTIKEDKAGRPYPVEVYERTINVTELKKVIANRIEVAEPGPLRMHLPADTPDKYVRELVSETLINGKWYQRGHNELTDIWVGAEAGRQLLAPENRKIDWINDRPIWATPFLPSQETKQAGMAAPEMDFFDRLRRFNKTRGDKGRGRR